MEYAQAFKRGREVDNTKWFETHLGRPVRAPHTAQSDRDSGQRHHRGRTFEEDAAPLVGDFFASRFSALGQPAEEPLGEMNNSRKREGDLLGA
mgnify:CR=1 FL=1